MENKNKKTDNSHISREDFPAAFIFGTGAAAYQHEGGATKGGRGVSIWDHFTWNSPRRIADGSNGNLAVDMYTKFEEDIMNMKKMGFDAYRFSISWPRVLPGGRRDAGVNRDGVNFYNQVIDTLLANGIEPYVTLFHWDLPQCLQDEYDGFLSKHIVKDFREYAELCFWEFGDRVKHWFTINEPWSYSALGYAQCVFPPTQSPPPPNRPSQRPHCRPNHENLFGINAVVTNHGNLSGIHEVTDDGDLSGIEEVTHRVSRTVLSLYKDIDNIATDSLGPLGVDNIATDSLGPLGFNNFIANARRRPHHHNNVTDPGDNTRNAYKPGDAYTVTRNLLLAHGEAVKSYRTKFQKHQEGKIGITLNCHWHKPLHETSREDQEAAIRAVEFMMGWFLEPIIKGKYPDSMIKYVPEENLAKFSDKEVELIKGSIDYLGLNYYTTYYATYDRYPKQRPGYMRDQHLKATPKRGDKLIGPNVAPSWIYVVPEGIYDLLNYVNDKYNDDGKLPPVYITENGLDEINNVKLTVGEACADPRRVKYHQDHLAYVLKAVKDFKKDMDIKGYFAWSYCDNFEWAQGYESRFGIMYIDYKNDNARHPKDSALWFTEFLTKKKNMGTKKRTLTLKVNEADKEAEKEVKAA